MWGGIRNPAIFSVFKPRAPRLRRTKIKPRYRWEEPRFLKIHYVRNRILFSWLGVWGCFQKTAAGEFGSCGRLSPVLSCGVISCQPLKGVGRVNVQISVKVFVRPVCCGERRAIYEKILSPKWTYFFRW